MRNHVDISFIFTGVTHIYPCLRYSALSGGVPVSTLLPGPQCFLSCASQGVILLTWGSAEVGPFWAINCAYCPQSDPFCILFRFLPCRRKACHLCCHFFKEKNAKKQFAYNSNEVFNSKWNYRFDKGDNVNKSNIIWQDATQCYEQ